jgi:phage tail-like protein
MNETYPITAFHFRLSFNGLAGINDTDTKFQSVSGIKATLDFDNSSTRAKDETNVVKTIFNPVILRRGMVDPKQSVLLQWVFKCLNEPVYDPLPEVLIEVLNEEHVAEITIKLINVSVKSWSAGELNAQKSELLMEELALDYQSIELIGGQ